MNRTRLTGGWLLVLALTGGSGWAQVPQPSPEPERIVQDELDLQARASVVQGSGARAYGMGGAFLARADDATAASWNPAGLSYLRLPELSAVWTSSNFDTQAGRVDTPSQPAIDNRHGNTPDFFAATYPVQVGGASGAAQLSFQRIISFKSDRSIIDPAGGVTSDVSAKGGFDVLALGTGLQVTHGLRLGLTVNRWFNGLTQHKTSAVDTPSRFGTRVQDARLRLSGWNVNFGAIWSPSEKVNFGLVAKTSYTGRIDLQRERTDDIKPRLNPTANDYSSQQLVRDFPASKYASLDNITIDGITLDFPGAVGVGVSLRPSSPLTISADYTRTFWSKGRIHNFFTLPATGRPLETSPQDYFPVLPYPSLTDPHQEDTEQVRIGVEYVVLRGRIKWPLRAGYFNDRQFFHDFSGSAPRFDGWTAGTGLILGPMLVDVAYVYEGGSYKDVDAAQVRVRSHRVFASLIYRHSRH